MDSSSFDAQPGQAHNPNASVGASGSQAEFAAPASSAGAVDLSSLGQQTPGQATEASDMEASLGQWATMVTEESLQEFAQLSTRVPAFLVAYSARSEAADSVVRVVDDAVEAQAGKFVLGVVDVDEHPRVAQALQIQQVPMLLAVLGGRPMPLFAGPVDSEQMAATLQELQQVAVQQGMASTVAPINTAGAEAAGGRFAEADALVAQGEYDAARALYERAVEENPADAEAEAGVHRVDLLKRVSGFDAQVVRDAAASNPDDVHAQIDVADLDVVGGHVDDAFLRLIRFIGAHRGDDREAARVHLVELFSAVGQNDPRVAAGRRKLAMSLF
ncbi:tetratricopeptide repeat protein [Pseudoglutamicibacter albus]|uniref:Thioredoxin n=1 Tax=Pseudoglutamicibacter albus TaxID=98671 RepID=A0ABU1Z129_9MICC|nr:tetratricopeptide repeat protein [Pseudoglutamicibacter albus]MDR7293716.1 putative thioredoxin [Pseudoglutamicibacter albus]